MSFSDFASRLRQQAPGNAGGTGEPRNFEEIYTLRARILGVLIRDARQAAGLSPEQCAARIGASVETLLRWEFGQVVPSLPQIELLAYALDVPVSHFWGTQTLAERANPRAIDREQYVLIRDRLIGVLLRAAREKQNLSVEQVAAETGLSAAQVEAYELGEQPVPLPALVSLAHVCQVNLTHFLERSSRVGSALATQEDLERFRDLPDELRQFAALPVNQSYLELAMRLSQMSSAELRSIAEAILNITL